MSQPIHGISMERFYELEGITRQGYFQSLIRDKEQASMMQRVFEEVKIYRKNQDRRAGSRSLYYNLGIKEKYSIGVSKFERLMREYGLSLAPVKLRIVTTQSCSRSRQYGDLAKGQSINGINQLVVGDLTYIIFVNQTYYLFLLTDVYSARIVGWNLGTRMRVQEAYQAFLTWIKLRGEEQIKGCIHHTDGGSQYFSNFYMEAMQAKELCISVAENCVDNGFAEQRNGLIKNHFVPTIKDLQTRSLSKEMDEIMYFYNNQRKQEALGWLSPVEFEQELKTVDKPPTMKIYNRETNKRTARQRFFKE